MRVHAEAAEKEFREVALKFIYELFLEFAKDSMKLFRPGFNLDFQTFVIEIQRRYDAQARLPAVVFLLIPLIIPIFV